MNAALFFALAAVELAGLFAIWFFLKAKIRSYLELQNLLAGVREEARALVLELNETADRNVSLVEDRIGSLRELLAEVDRRIVVEKRELETRSVEREVYAKLARRRPIVPSSEALPPPEPASQARRAPEPSARDWARAPVRPVEVSRPDEASAAPAEARPEDAPIPLSLGPAAEARVSDMTSIRAPGREAPEVKFSDELLLNSRSKREEALDLYRQGISAQLIAAKLGATVAEIELLVEMEERRAEAEGGTSRGAGRGEGRF